MTAKCKFLSCMLAAFSVIGERALAADAPQSSSDFANKSIEELMNIDVTTAGRKQQKLSKTPAAIYVVTREAIQRSGATNIPDVLRMVPGVQVAQVEANRWAISVRGFNGVYSNKLLVMVDNRTVYTPTFSGVYWDQLVEIPLDTIERIEVVRGAGGTVWGANAVNGVINIITKSSSETQGTTITTGAGSSQRAQTEAVFGDHLGKSASYRIYGQFASFAANQLPGGGVGHDKWNAESGGFRLDRDAGGRDSYSVNGNFFATDGSADLRQLFFGASGGVGAPLGNQGFDVTARWTRKHTDRSESSLQIYDTHYVRTDTLTRERDNTIDFDFQNHTRVGTRNDLVWGAGFRETNILGATESQTAAFESIGMSGRLQPQELSQRLFSGFAQDEIRFGHNVSLTGGIKVEHNTFTGLSYEPSIRLGWSVTEASFLWLAASEADRQPSYLDELLDLQYAPVTLASDLSLDLTIKGNRHIAAERVQDYEAGYRVAPAGHLSLDFTGYYSRYRDLDDTALLTPYFSTGSSGTILHLPFGYRNGAKAAEFGAELAAAWNIVPRWKLTASYSWLNMQVRSQPAASAAQLAAIGGVLPESAQLISSIQASTASADSISPPRHQSGLQTYFDATSKLTLDGAVYYVSRLPQAVVPSYVRLDGHVSYKLTRFLSASLVGQNLGSSRHVEMDPTSQFLSTEVPRSIFGKLVWTF